MFVGEADSMSNLVDSFGHNAGKLWKMLYEKGSLKENMLLKNSQLKDDEFYCAIGWLARENKIYFDGNSYSLGETNLVDKIGKDAGKVWMTLSIWDDLDVASISHLTRINKHDVYAALGWLARENKIDAKSVKTQIRYLLK